MPVDVFGNSGLGSLGLDQGGGQPQPTSGPLPNNGANPLVQQLVQSLAKAAQTQQRAVLPQQLPPRQSQAGDVSGNFVNPSTVGGPKHNARVSMAQAIGNVAAQAINRHEQVEAQKLGNQITLVESAANTLNDPNASPATKQLAQEQLNGITPAEWKKIAKATGIQIFGEDKRTNTEKQAMQIAQQKSQSQNNPVQQQGGSVAAQQRQNNNAPIMNEQNGIPGGLNQMAQQFLRKLPIQTGLSSQAQATAQLTQAGVIPTASDILKYAGDQQYYQMMSQKFGADEALKFQKIQEEYVTKNAELAEKYYKADQDNQRKDLMLQIRENQYKAVDAINNARIGLMQQQVDINKSKADDSVKKVQIDALKTQGAQNRALIQSQTQILDQAQRSKNKDLIKDSQTKLDQLKKDQEGINKKLQDFGGSSGEDFSNPALEKLFTDMDKRIGLAQ